MIPPSVTEKEIPKPVKTEDRRHLSVEELVKKGVISQADYDWVRIVAGFLNRGYPFFYGLNVIAV